MFCERTKEFLSQNSVEYTDRNVATDPDALRHLTEVYGVMTTPVTVVGDEVIVGFNQKKLEAALGL